ncbi:MAG: hypothetical protein HC897_14150, partial [Thermoanaerobaculia bacterium]|nr:hypothetical protein [Thermoanaerobaculia bacterium]
MLTPMKRRRQILVILTLQAVSTLLLAELGLRLLAPHYEKLRQLLYMPAAITDFGGFPTLEALLAPTMLGWGPYRTRDGFVLSSRGLRTGEYTAPKAPGSYRVAVVGDSFVFSSGGVPYSLAMPHLLEAGLRERTRRRVDVFALGVPGS